MTYSAVDDALHALGGNNGGLLDLLGLLPPQMRSYLINPQTEAVT